MAPTRCSCVLQLDYRFPSSVPVSQPLKELLCRVFVKTREARIGLGELAAHPWVVDGGELPPIATVPTPAGGLLHSCWSPPTGLSQHTTAQTRTPSGGMAGGLRSHAVPSGG